MGWRVLRDLDTVDWLRPSLEAIEWNDHERPRRGCFLFEQRKWGALECTEVLDMLEGIKYLNLSSHER